MKYDYLIVGCGLFGATFAQHAIDRGKSVLMIDKRDHIGGNVFTKSVSGINVHVYGPHIFHTSNQTVWNYINQFATFNHYVNRPKVSYKDKLYSFPINLMTLYQLWGVKTPAEAQKKLEEVRVPIENPRNLEDWVLSQVGEEIYHIFIKGYTEKQWQCLATELPSSIIRRLPIRLTYDDNYFNDNYQGIPIGGYTPIIKKMIEGATVDVNVDYLKDKETWDKKAKKILYTGRIDTYFDYRYGELNYRTLRFENKIVDGDYQGNAVINFTDRRVPYTRIVEHKHFEFKSSKKSVITREYPDVWHKDKIPYYPINNEQNMAVYKKYKALSKKEPNVLFGGRLAEYRYYDMHQVIASAMVAVAKEFNSGT